jgi:hypothetical protein
MLFIVNIPLKSIRNIVYRLIITSTATVGKCEVMSDCTRIEFYDGLCTNSVHHKNKIKWCSELSVYFSWIGAPSASVPGNLSFMRFVDLLWIFRDIAITAPFQ